MKKLLVIGALCFILLGSPAVSLAQTLSISQLQAIVASLQAQLNTLIAQLNQLQQQQNNSKPIESIKTSIISPTSGESLIIGVLKNVTFSKPWPYESNCFNRLQLMDVNNKVVGEMWVDKGQRSVIWNVSSISSSACGTGNTRQVVKPGKYKFRIKAVSTDGMQEVNVAESGYFNIIEKTQSSPSITVTSPNGGEKLVAGTLHNISWKTGMTIEPPTIALQEYPTFGSGFTNIIAAGVPNTGSYQWLVPRGTEGSKYKIQVYPAGARELVDYSDDYFSIINTDIPSLKSSLKVTVLNGAAQCFRAPCEVTLPNAVVQIFNDKGVLVDKKTATSGYVLFTNLNPGTYIVLASAPGVSSRETRLGLVSGQNSEIKMTLGGFGTQAPTDSQLAAVLQSLKGVLSGLSGALTP